MCGSGRLVFADETVIFLGAGEDGEAVIYYWWTIGGVCGSASCVCGWKKHKGFGK